MSWGNRILAFAVRGVVRALAEATKGGYPQLKVTLQEGDTPPNVSQVGQYGLATVPQEGAEAIVLALGPNDLVAIAVDDRRYRLKGLKSGEVALYDDLDQRMHLTRDGIVLKSPSVTADAADIKLGAEAFAGVARVGDAVQVTDVGFAAWVAAVHSYVNGLVPGGLPPVPTRPTGQVTAGSTRVKAD